MMLFFALIDDQPSSIPYQDEIENGAQPVALSEHAARLGEKEISMSQQRDGCLSKQADLEKYTDRYIFVCD
jgi:hypothetical protein